MTGSKRQPPKGGRYDGKGKGSLALLAEQHLDESEDAALARTTLAPSTQAALTLHCWRPIAAEQDINALSAELKALATAASTNDLGRLEAMLAVQAHTLDALFNDMARRARLNIVEYPLAFERYMRLALKAQSQCRTTIESLAEIKNPRPVAFVQQANIAAGPQQVNNGPAPARAENANQPSEILEGGSHGNRLEQGTAGAGIAGDSSLATLGQGDRTEIARG